MVVKYLLLLGLCYFAYAQNTRECSMSVEQLFRNGCPRACITFQRGSLCPVCLDAAECRDSADPADTIDLDECRPDDPQRSCSDTQICLANGIIGRYNCTERLRERQECQEDIGDFFESLGLESRNVVDRVTNFVVPCLSGLVCRREALDRHTCVPETGPCPVARMQNSQVRCDDRGLFEPLQCRRADSSRSYQCVCVNPQNGAPVSGSRVEVQEREDIPNCARSCEFRSVVGAFAVPSGETFINFRNCSRCLCRNGEMALCQDLPEGSCDRLNSTPAPNRNCMVRGRTLPNGESVAVDCNRCICKNGELACTRRDCEDDEEEDDDEDDPADVRNCRACGAMRHEPVCGSDGRTYPSRCFAVNCRGLSADSLTPGPCTGRDVCRDIPCGPGEICLRNGGVTCLSREGCLSDRLRRCVNFLSIRCERREVDDEEEENESPTNGDLEETPSENEASDDDAEAVCGSNGRTFSSVCNLVQSLADVEIAYTGRCNRTECSSGQVCGTDGVTYINTCELQTRSSNARVDYRGACEEEEPDEVVDDRCSRLRRTGRCATRANCGSLVRPGDGCCPICGGAVTIGLDQDALDEYVRLNPQVDTIDELSEILISSGFISKEVLRSCKFDVNLIRTGDLHMVLESLGDENGMICAMAAERIADRINNPPEMTVTTAPNPQVLQLATVAQTSPVVDEDGNILPMPTEGGAVSVASYSLAVMLIPILALLL